MKYQRIFEFSWKLFMFIEPSYSFKSYKGTTAQFAHQEEYFTTKVSSISKSFLRKAFKLKISKVSSSFHYSKTRFIHECTLFISY